MFNLNGESSSGHDGLTGHFCQVCWDVVGADVVRIMHAFFNGNTLPKSITHTNLILFPKKDLI